MATTNKQLAIWAAEAMGLEYKGHSCFYDGAYTVYSAKIPKDQHALAMLCVAEGVNVIGGYEDSRIMVRKLNTIDPAFCTRDQLVRTILSEYVKMKRGE